MELKQISYPKKLWRTCLRSKKVPPFRVELVHFEFSDDELKDKALIDKFKEDITKVCKGIKNGTLENIVIGKDTYIEIHTVADDFFHDFSDRLIDILSDKYPEYADRIVFGK